VSTPALVSPDRRFWPVGVAVQAGYEALRTQALATAATPGTLVARPARRGLPGLIVGDHEIPQVGGVRDHVIPHPAIT
jgi:hypothetical protein